MHHHQPLNHHNKNHNHDTNCPKFFILELSWLLEGLESSSCGQNVVGSTVRLRFRKITSGHHFQIIRKLSKNDFQYHKEVIHNIQKYILTIFFFSSLVRNFTLTYDPYSCLIYVLFSLILMETIFYFFKCSLNFRAHALQLELNKVGYSNFVKF